MLSILKINGSLQNMSYELTVSHSSFLLSPFHSYSTVKLKFPTYANTFDLVQCVYQNVWLMIQWVITKLADFSDFQHFYFSNTSDDQ
jgi:hypothetical protein